MEAPKLSKACLERISRVIADALADEWVGERISQDEVTLLSKRFQGAGFPHMLGWKDTHPHPNVLRLSVNERRVQAQNSCCDLTVFGLHKLTQLELGDSVMTTEATVVSTGSFFYRAAGKKIDPEFLKHLFQTTTSYWSAAAADDGKLATIIINDTVKGPLLQQLEEFLEQNEELSLYIYAARAEAGMNEKDYQPFDVIKDEEGMPVAVAFIEGDVIGHTDTDSAHTDTANFVSDYFREKLQEMYDDSDGNLEKLRAKLDRKSFEEDVLKHFGPNVFMSILFRDGEDKTISRTNEANYEGDGWFTSDKMGWGDEPKAVAEEPKKKGGLFSAFNKKDKPTVAAKEGASAPVIVAPKTATAIPSVQAKKQEEIIQAPSHLKGRALARFYRRNLGDDFEAKVPEWENYPKIPVSLLLPSSGFREWLNGHKKLTEVTNVESKESIAEASQEQARTDKLPQLNPSLLKDLQETWNDPSNLLTEDQIQNVEMKYPPLSEQWKKPDLLQHAAHWEFETMMKFTTAKPRAAALLMREVLYQLCHHEPDLLKMPGTKKEEAAVANPNANKPTLTAPGKKGALFAKAK